MKFTMFAAAATAALSLSACDPMMNDPTGASSAMAGDMTPVRAMPYVMMAGASDMFEIESSRLALQRARMPETRQFAQMLINHHMQTTEATMAAARAAGLNPPPPRLMPMQQQMLAQLRSASGGNFEATYFRQQVPAHEMALALHTNYANNGDQPSLRGSAQSAIPVVTQHLEQARAMAGRM